MNVAFCINQQALLGFGPAIVSLIRNCSQPQLLQIHILCSGISPVHKERIGKLLEAERFTGTVRYIGFDAKSVFGSLDALHNDYTTYGRLLLPDYINEPAVLYLDADLIVEADVYRIADLDFRDCALAAVPDGSIGKMMGSEFYVKTLQLSPMQPAFNAGVLYLNLSMWREKKYTNACINMATTHYTEIKSHDQTILNAFFKGRFIHLPDGFNSIWYPQNGRPQKAERMILHFAGAPKPWDVFGGKLHDGFDSWRAYLTDEWQAWYTPGALASLKRIWRLRRAYIRMIIINFVMYFRRK